jgi:hypothetical protein
MFPDLLNNMDFYNDFQYLQLTEKILIGFHSTTTTTTTTTTTNNNNSINNNKSPLRRLYGSRNVKGKY